MPFAAEAPLNATIIALNAADVLVKALLKDEQPSILCTLLWIGWAFITPAATGDLAILPNDVLTPGQIITTSSAEVCVPAHARTMRHTSGKMKAHVYRRYGIDRHSGHFEVDHRIPLELGGADTEANLWPESYDTEPWNAHLKDLLEDRLHALVCHGEMPLQEAQSAFFGNWIDAYRRYIGDR